MNQGQNAQDVAVAVGEEEGAGVAEALFDHRFPAGPMEEGCVRAVFHERVPSPLPGWGQLADFDLLDTLNGLLEAHRKALAMLVQ